MDHAFVRGYTEATGAHSDGSAAPPLAIAARIFEAQLAGINELHTCGGR